MATPIVASPPGPSLTAEQFRLVLEAIAGRCDTLSRLLAQAQCDEDFPAGVATDAAQALATSIGSMADSAVGGCIIGSHDRWSYGPNFEGTSDLEANHA